uniref:Calmodulin binding transcription activator 1 n=1 Tax=Apteryx owenii TaxID=8824 RepID=A0A8B9PE18_APTOW
VVLFTALKSVRPCVLARVCVPSPEVCCFSTRVHPKSGDSTTKLRFRPHTIACRISDGNDDHGNSNGSHVKIFLPKKLLECLPKCSSLPKERHRWNTNERCSERVVEGTGFKIRKESTFYKALLPEAWRCFQSDG